VTVANGNTLGLVFDYSGAGTLRKQCGTLSIRRSSYQYGNYSAKAKNTPILKMDYTYWSTPVVNQN
jgi:hypothetical protein